MVDLILYLGVAAGSGAVWSLLQFLKKVQDFDAEESWSDFDWRQFLATVVLNSAGGVAAAWGIPLLSSVEPSITLAVVGGLYGEKGLELVLALKDNYF